MKARSNSQLPTSNFQPLPTPNSSAPAPLELCWDVGSWKLEVGSCRLCPPGVLDRPGRPEQSHLFMAARRPQDPRESPRPLRRRGDEDAGAAAGVSRPARGEGAAGHRSDRHRLRCRRTDVGAGDAGLHVGAERRQLARADQQRRGARGPERRRRDGQAHGVRRQAGAAARAQGARRRRARRRAAQPLAHEGHQRRPEGGYEGPGQRFLRPRRRQHRAQRQQPVLGPRQHHLHVRARLAPALQERQVRDDPDAGARPVGRLDGRRRPHLPQRQRRAAVRGLRRGEVLRAQSRTWCGRAASTIR